MLKRANYSQEVLSGVSDGFKGELELLRYEYDRRVSAQLQRLDELLAFDTVPGAVREWRAYLSGDRTSMLVDFTPCIDAVAHLEETAAQGRLSGLRLQVCADVARAEAQVLDLLTGLQRRNSASLQQVFRLGLPGLIKNLDPAPAALLRAAVNAQADDAQFVSNELQDLAIFLKERNKVITHPLDENHPE